MPRTKEQDREYQRKRRAQKAAGAQASPTERKPRSGRVHRSAVTRMLRATGLSNVPEEAPLVELLKSLALEMDEAPSASTSTRYRLALADVRKVLDAAAAPSSKPSRARGVQPTPDVPDEPVPEPTSLAKFKQKRGIG